MNSIQDIAKSIAELHARLDNIGARAANLADVVCGVQQSPERSLPPSAHEPSGLLAQLQVGVNEALAKSDRIGEALERLEFVFGMGQPKQATGAYFEHANQAGLAAVGSALSPQEQYRVRMGTQPHA